MKELLQRYILQRSIPKTDIRNRQGILMGRPWLTVSAGFLFLFFAWVIPAFAQRDAVKTFDQIKAQRDKIPFESARLTMRMVAGNGKSRERVLQTWSHNTPSRTRLMLVFDAPADVKGTALLGITREGNSQQKLFLPATGKIQTISNAQKADRFLGTDFTYEDLGEYNSNDFTYQTLSEQGDRWVVRATPKTKAKNGYAWVEHTVDTKRLLLLSSQFYDAKGKLLRQLTVDQVAEVKSGVWKSSTMTMKDVVRGSQTTLTWKQRTFDPIPDQNFTERFMQRSSQ